MSSMTSISGDSRLERTLRKRIYSGLQTVVAGVYDSELGGCILDRRLIWLGLR
jgi:hypothetical protein